MNGLQVALPKKRGRDFFRVNIFCPGVVRKV